jgi:Domain of unknown function (DUF1844)
MPEEETKGFKVVDKRGRADEEREKPEASPPPTPPKETGNQPAPGGVQREKSPADAPSAVGGPSFLDLVGTLQFGAMAHLGMIQTPDGKRPPVNLPAAKDSIDILVILQEKTKGNLTSEENEVLGEGLYHLRMAYLAAMNAGQGTGGKEK